MVIKHAAERLDSPGKFAAGDVISARELTTIRSERILAPDLGTITHLQFRRFAGCPICNLHLWSIACRHGELTAAGIREVAVFHASGADMLPYQASSRSP
jgi:hypothetical protein